MKKLVSLLFALCLGFFYLHAQVPFSCTNVALQVTSNSSSDPSTLYSYNITTGVRTQVANLNQYINAVGYGSVSNLLWGYARNSRQIASIDANGTVTNYTVPNLPNVDFDGGEIIPGDYLVLYIHEGGRYYVVDVNPAHATFGQLVNPATGFSLQTGPTFGKALSRTLFTNDFIYDPVSGLLTGITSPNPGEPDDRRVFTINPATGVVTLGEMITGDGIRSETQGYGAQFFDATGSFYAFANDLGKFYKVDLTTGVATLVSTTTMANTNDGASCGAAVLLPVKLVSFNAALQNCGVQLTWVTSTEENNSYFVIERSKDGTNFSEAGRVTGAGNLSSIHNYSYNDNDVSPQVYYYRLRQVDIDGKYTFSEVKKATVRCGNGMGASLYPTVTSAQITVTGLKSGQFLRIINVDGREVLPRVQVKSTTQLVSTERLANAVYFVQVFTSDGTIIQTMRLVKRS